jgi:hypothetical protein
MINTKTVIVDVQLDDMYRQYIECCADIYTHDFEAFRNDHVNFCRNLLFIGQKDKNGIRQMFHEGYTAMLVPMNHIDVVPRRTKPLELRVWDDQELLMVLTDDEVNY